MSACCATPSGRRARGPPTTSETPPRRRLLRPDPPVTPLRHDRAEADHRRRVKRPPPPSPPRSAGDAPLSPAGRAVPRGCRRAGSPPSPLRGVPSWPVRCGQTHRRPPGAPVFPPGDPAGPRHTARRTGTGRMIEPALVQPDITLSAHGGRAPGRCPTGHPGGHTARRATGGVSPAAARRSPAPARGRTPRRWPRSAPATPAAPSCCPAGRRRGSSDGRRPSRPRNRRRAPSC